MLSTQYVLSLPSRARVLIEREGAHLERRRAGNALPHLPSLDASMPEEENPTAFHFLLITYEYAFISLEPVHSWKSDLLNGSIGLI